MLNDEKCIMIEVNEESFKKTVWISKNTYSLRKAKLEFPNGEVLDYEYELRFNYVKTRDVSLPDITKYKFLDSINTINKDNNNETSTNSVDNSQVVSPANFQTNN